ncbi:MAG: DUF6414 family protein [Acidimicrobiales bacterium]
MHPEIGGDLLQRHPRLTPTSDRNDIFSELPRIRLRHNDILPGPFPEQASSDVTSSCSRPLFSNSRFRVLCRLTQTGLQESWTPVKLVDVLSDVVPDLALQVDIAGRGVLAAMGGAAAADSTAERSRRVMRAALLTYAKSFADHYSKNLTEEDLAQSGLPSPDHCNAYGTLKGRRGAFDSITSYIQQRFDIAHDPVVAAQYRSAALLDAGLGLDGRLTAFAPTLDSLAPARSDERFLDAELVAMYW